MRSLKVIDVEDIDRLIPKQGPKKLFISSLEEFKKARPVNSCSEESDSDDGASLAPRSKRRCLNNAQLQLVLNEPDVNEIHTALKATLPGTIVLSHYRANKVLDDYTRNILCTQVIHLQLKEDYNRALERKDFDDLAELIVELFKKESKSTYYDVVKKKNCTTVSGRLRTKYYTIRKGLINALLIPSPNDNESSSANVNVNFDDIGEDETDDNFTWLLNNSEPWDTVLEKWELTALRRKKHLLLSERIELYIQKFPCVHKELGWKLLAADGIRAQPALEISLRESWPEYSKFLLTIIRQTKKKFLVGRKYSALSTEQQFVAIWLELPKLFKVRTLPKPPKAGKKDPCWRASNAEIQEGLCLHVEECAEIYERIQTMKKTLFKHKHQLQPLPVLVGPVNAIQQSFIVLDDNRWEVSDPFEAVEGTFRLIFGLDAKYPAAARHLWLFIQLTLFKFQTPEDYRDDTGLHAHISGRLKDFELFNSK